MKLEILALKDQLKVMSNAPYNSPKLMTSSEKMTNKEMTPKTVKFFEDVNFEKAQKTPSIRYSKKQPGEITPFSDMVTETCTDFSGYCAKLIEKPLEESSDNDEPEISQSTRQKNILY